MHQRLLPLVNFSVANVWSNESGKTMTSSISGPFCMNRYTVRRRWRRDYDRFMAAFGKTFGFGFHPGQQDTCQTYYSVFLLSSSRKVNCQIIFVMYIPDRKTFQRFEFCIWFLEWNQIGIKYVPVISNNILDNNLVFDIINNQIMLFAFLFIFCKMTLFSNNSRLSNSRKTPATSWPL